MQNRIASSIMGQVQAKGVHRAKLLLVGWESAEWDIMEPLVEAGEMPHLNRLIDNGVMGRLATFDPPLPPLTWTSIATGKRPEQHGILGLEEPAANGIDVRPFSTESRRCPAVWNILSAAGKRCHVVGWPFTSPAEQINGMMLSSGWDTACGDVGTPWEFPADSATPETFAETAAELRMHPGELNLHDLRSFIPSIEPTDPENEPAIYRLGQAAASAASRQAAITFLMENEPWDFLAIHFPSLEEIGRLFVEFHPPRMPHLTAERYEKFRNVVNEAYRFHDQMLGRIIELAGSETTVVLCSASGLHTGNSRAVPETDKTISYVGHHRATGLLFVAGPNIRRDEIVYGAALNDIAPTILGLLGSGIPADLPGRVLAEVFVEPMELSRVEPPPPKPADAGVSAKRLPDGSPSPAMLAVLENDFNLARSLQASGRHDLALPFLETMHRERPLRISPAIHLVHCYRALGRTSEAVQTLEEFADRLKKNQAERPAAFLPQFDLMRGLLALDRGDRESALACLRKAEAQTGQTPAMQIQLGQVYARVGMAQKAEEAFERALEIDPDNGDGHAGLSAALYRQKRYQEAAEPALAAASHVPWLGRNHLQLARCLARLGRDQDALLAIHNALRLQPALIEAHRLAIVLQLRNGGDVSQVEWHKEAVAKLLPWRRHAWELLKASRRSAVATGS